MGLGPGQDRQQVPLAEDQHPVGDLGPGREHEPFRLDQTCSSGATARSGAA
jgi:hypothetical protein